MGRAQASDCKNKNSLAQTLRGWRFTYQPYETVLGGMGRMWSYVTNVGITN